MEENGKGLPTGYKYVRKYMDLLVNRLYYSKTYCVNPDNVPPAGVPTVIVSNHQNGLNDAFGVISSLPDRKVSTMVRADIFSVSPLLTRILYWSGLLPAFRLDWDGADALKNNEESFSRAEDILLDGGTVLLFPEARHQNRRWLGNFTSGYTKIAFEAAARSNFEKEIFIVPSCNHYSSYFGFRNQAMTVYGTPVSLQPYYDLYKVHPRTAQRELNKVIRSAVDEMMLDIRDENDYTAIDFIREDLFGDEYAVSKGLDPSSLPDKLASDKALVAALAKAEEEGEDTSGLYDSTRELMKDISDIGVTADEVLRPRTKAGVALDLVLLLVLLPLALCCAVPFAVCAVPPIYITDRLGDRLFEGTAVVLCDALLILPLLAIVIFVWAWVKASLFLAIIQVLLIPVALCFEWFYIKKVSKTAKEICWISAVKKGKASKVKAETEEILTKLRKIVK